MSLLVENPILNSPFDEPMCYWAYGEGQPGAGVFVGHVSAMVRERLWKKVCKHLNGGGALILWSTNTEQRFQMDMFGVTDRHVVDYDGLQLIRIPYR